jgi:hypothetical protein
VPESTLLTHVREENDVGELIRLQPMRRILLPSRHRHRQRWLPDPLRHPGPLRPRQANRPGRPQRHHQHLPRELNASSVGCGGSVSKLTPSRSHLRAGVELMVQRTGMSSDPLCRPPSGHTHGSGTVKRLLRRVVPTQDRNRPQDLIRKWEASDCQRRGTERPVFPLVTGWFVGLAGLEPGTSSLSAIGGLPLCNPAFLQVVRDRQGPSDAL